MKLRLASTCVLALGVVAFAGPASAGTDDKEKHDAVSGASAAVDAQASAPGNSANAPGQIKKEAEGAQQDVEAAPTAVPVAVAGSSGGNVGAKVGVKSASDTEKDTHEAASSDKTKQYGNGKTAGQIAMQKGAPAATILHGPGNSQPHKAAPCSGGHEVDVHALKGKRLAKLCGPASPPGSNPNPNPGPGSNPGGSSNGGGNSQSSGGSAAGAVTNPPGPNGSPAGPGSSSAGSGVQGSGGSEGVLAETGVAGQTGSLPFTGFPLWIALLVGVGLIVAGLWLVRRTEVNE
jgi:hypothetical protein